MTPDHENRLASLAEKLADVFLDEADPTNWPGAGKTPAEQTKEERGDRAWSLKGANQLGLLFARALELKQRVRWQIQSDLGGDEAPPSDGSLGTPDAMADMDRLEREAKQLLDRVMDRR